MITHYREPRWVRRLFVSYHATIGVTGLIGLLVGPPLSIEIVAGGSSSALKVSWSALFVVSSVLGVLGKLFHRSYVEMLAFVGAAIGTSFWVGAAFAVAGYGGDISEQTVSRFLATIQLTVAVAGTIWAFTRQRSSLINSGEIDEAVKEVLKEVRTNLQGGDNA